MENFINWLESNGVNMKNIKLIEIENKERSVLTNKDLKYGDDFFLIPKKLLIMSTSVEKSEVGQIILKLFSNSTTLTKNIINITIFILLSMKGYYEETFWKPYYDILPKNVKHIPIFWTKELYYLKGSPLLLEIRDKVKSTRVEYNKLKNSEVPIKEYNITFNEYKKIRSLVSSRNFNLSIEGKQSTTMVPLADMLNHNSNADTNWNYNNNLKSYQMTMKNSVKRGNEVSDSYGRKTNDKYFLYYGFLLSDAKVQLKIKTKSFQGNLNKNINSIEMENLLNHLRRKHLEPEQKYNYGFVDVYNEKNVMRDFKRILNKMKRKYPRTLSFYRKNKKTGSLNKKNAYTLVYMELSIIEDYIKKINLILDYLHGKKSKIKDIDVKEYLKIIKII
jgi:hypothetical protein